MRTGKKKTARRLTAFTAVLLAITFLLPVGASASMVHIDFTPWYQISSILRDTVAREDFYDSLDQPPLVCKSDVDEDYLYELITVFPVWQEYDQTVCVYTESWIIDALTNEITLCNTGALYSEVGGNNGDVSLAEKDGKLYTITRSTTVDGTDFNEFIHITALADPTSMDYDMIILNRRGNYFEEDEIEYLYDMEKFSRWEYEDILDDYDILYTMDLFTEPDPDSGFDIVPFSNLM